MSPFRPLVAFLLAVSLIFAGVPKAESAEITVIDIEGEIGGGTVDAVERGLDKGTQRVLIRINSFGGSVGAATKVTQLIERSKAAIVCEVDGFAASSAFYILQACPVRLMTERSILMAHEPSLAVQAGNIHSTENARAALIAVNEAMSFYMARRMGMDPKEFMERIKGKEWWMPAPAALEVHAVDAVLPSHNVR